MTAEVLPQNDYMNWSLNQLSRAFGIARETVGSRLAAANVSPSGHRRGHAVYSVKDAAVAILLPTTGGIDGLQDPEKMAPQDRKAWFSSERDRLALEKEQGLLVDVEDCRQQMVKIIEVGLPIFDSLGDELERDFGLAPEIVTSIEERIYVAKTKWADAIQELD